MKFFLVICLGIELQFFAEDVLIFGIDVVIEEIKEPGNAGERDDDGGPSGGGLLGDLEITASRVFLEIEVEQLVFNLQRFTKQLHVASYSSSSSSSTTTSSASSSCSTATSTTTAWIPLHSKKKKLNWVFSCMSYEQ